MSTKTKASIHIRWMIRRDMEEVLAIEADAFPYPWNEEDFVGCLRRRNCIGMVAERDGAVVGFMVYELNKKGLLLLNFAVEGWRQRSGIGTHLVEKLKSKLSKGRRTYLRTHVREGNLDAQLFFKAMGFQATKVCPDFYDDSTEDAYLFEYRI